MPANLGFPRSKVVVSSEQSGGLLEAKWWFARSKVAVRSKLQKCKLHATLRV